MRRTLLHYKMDVYRACKRQVPLLECEQAINDALDALDQKANWEFSVKETLLRMEAPYTTGTINLTDNDDAVVGNGTSWDMAWSNKTLRSGSYIDMPIASVDSVTALTLANDFSGPTSLTDQSYVLYQDTYNLPADCEPGRDVSIKGPTGWGPEGDGFLPKIPRALHERWKQEVGTGGDPQWFTDAGLTASATNLPKIMVYPYPTETTNVRLLYYARLARPSLDSEYISLPESFERLVIEKASSQLMFDKNMPGWTQRFQKAAMMEVDLFNRFAASSAYELLIQPDDGSFRSFASMRGDRVFQNGQLLLR